MQATTAIQFTTTALRSTASFVEAIALEVEMNSDHIEWGMEQISIVIEAIVSFVYAVIQLAQEFQEQHQLWNQIMSFGRSGITKMTEGLDTETYTNTKLVKLSKSVMRSSREWWSLQSGRWTAMIQRSRLQQWMSSITKR